MSDLLTPCREWQGRRSKKGGYGQRDVPGRGVVRVHRWVVEQVHGREALRGRVVMHLCDNPACFRYDHLRIGTPAENTADMVAKGRGSMQKRMTCPKGHPYDRTQVIRSGPKAGRTRRVCTVCAKEYHRDYFRLHGGVRAASR